jgi:hypothetical protein
MPVDERREGTHTVEGAGGGDRVVEPAEQVDTGGVGPIKGTREGREPTGGGKEGTAGAEGRGLKREEEGGAAAHADEEADEVQGAVARGRSGPLGTTVEDREALEAEGRGHPNEAPTGTGDKPLPLGGPAVGTIKIPGGPSRVRVPLSKVARPGPPGGTTGGLALSAHSKVLAVLFNTESGGTIGSNRKGWGMEMFELA